MSAPTLDDVKRELLAYKAKFGHPGLRGLLNTVANVNSASELKPDQYEAVIAACDSEPSVKASNQKSATDLDVDMIYAKWNSAGRRREA